MEAIPGRRWRALHALFMAVGSLALVAQIGCGGHAPDPVAPAPVDPTSMAATVSWIQAKARPLATAEATEPTTDLAFLKSTLGSARVVGLGEATHGSHEFQSFKDRIFRHLVLNEGYTAFGLEAQMGLCRALNRYIQTGEGDPIALVKRQAFWVWSTEEMVALVKWMRAYNLDPSHPVKLTFFGFDMQDGGEESDLVVAFVRKIDPDAADRLAAWYAPFRPFTFKGNQDYTKADAGLQAQCRANLKAALDWMVDHEAAYAAVGGQEEARWAVQMARVVAMSEAQQGAMLKGYDAYAIRDLGMADNAVWHLAQLGPGAKIVLSAHNGHLNRRGATTSWTPMGEHLATRLGSGYYSLGFAFREGGLVAQKKDESGTRLGILSNIATPTAEGSYEDAFSQTGLPLAFLDLRNLDVTQPGVPWMLKPHPLREVGAVWMDKAGWGVWDTVLPNRFHGLIWVRQVQATTLLK